MWGRGVGGVVCGSVGGSGMPIPLLYNALQWQPSACPKREGQPPAPIPPVPPSNYILLAYDCRLLIFGTPHVFTAEKWLSLIPMTPISFEMTSRQPERRMKWLVRTFMGLQQMLRTQAAWVHNQMHASHNMQLEMRLFSVFPLASGVAILP